MGAANRSPLGFGAISLFYLCLLAGAVFVQILHDRFGLGAGLGGVGVGLGVLVAIAIVKPRFYWDVFRSLKSAAVLLTLLVLSCILGTLLIQDLDLRRANVFNAGQAPPGEVPPFDDRQQSTRFALAEAHALQWLSPTEERARMMKEKVRLSPVEKEQVALRARAYGPKAAQAYEEAILGSKERQVEQLTTSNYARKNWKGFYKFWLFCKQLHLFDIFEAWWFYLLLGLIAVTVTVGTIARAPWTVRDIGIAITHGGILIILAGSLLDMLVAKEGYIYFTYGRPEEQVHSMIGDEKNQVYHHLPFRVYLDRFATEYYHELAVERLDWTRGPDGRPHAHGTNGHVHAARPFSVASLFPIREGIPRLYEGGDVKITVHAYKPRVLVKTVVDDVAGGPLEPAVRLGLYNRPDGGQNFFVHGATEPWLFAFDQRRYGFEMFGGRFEYVWARDAADFERLVRTPPLPDNGTLILRGPGGEVVEERVVIGETRQVRIGALTPSIEFVTIQSALAEAENVNLDRRLQKSEEPLLWLRVDGKRIQVPRDDSAFTRDFAILDGVEFRFDWPNPKDAGMSAIFRVVDGDGMEPVLVQADERGAARADRMVPGRPIPLARLQGGFLGLEGRVRSAEEKREIQAISDREFLGDVGGDEVALSGALREFFAERGAEGARMAQVCEELLAMDRRLPPHRLAAWRELIHLLEQQPNGGAPQLRPDWERYLKSEHPDLVRPWEKYLAGGERHVDEHLLAAWADVEVTGPWGTIRRELTPYDAPIEYGPKGERPVYVFAVVPTQQARDWFSVLSVIDHDGWKVHTHAAQVNSPLKYGGFRFFQATAATDRDGLGISGISVTMNPGVHFMYWGYSILTLGVCYLFFFRPALDRRRRARRRQESDA